MTTASKEHARTEAIRHRRELTAQEVRDAAMGFASHDWASLCGGALVTTYVSMTGEPPTGELRRVLATLDCKIALPIMRPQGQLEWGWDGQELTRNSYGIFEPPAAEIDIKQAKVMFIPALQVGVDGTRLGRGAGYFDRFLETMPRHIDGGPLRIVIAYDHEVVDSVPHELHDAPFDMIATPTRLITATE